MNQIKQGYKQTKVGIIPKDWEVVKLGEVLKIGSGKDYKHLSTGNIPVYGTGGYMLSVNEYLHDGESVCIGRKGTIDKPMFLNEKFWTVDTLFYTHSFKHSLPKYVYLTFLSIDWQKHNEASGVPSLSKTTIEAIQIPLPPLKEQEKIAEILTIWDEAITKQTELLEAKELLKKALMQKLLSGEVRFSGFSDEWEEVRLSKIIKLQGGYAFKSEEFKKKGIPIIRISNISNNSNYMEMNDLIYYDELSNESNFLIKKNDLLIAMSGATTGKVSIYNLEKKAYLNQRVGLFKVIKPTLINYSFLIQFVFSNFFSVQLKSLLVAGAQPNISSKDIESLKIKLPSLPEQQKIAEVLSLVDDEINLLKNELEELKLQKKALMQKLLTGQVRVKV